MPIPSWLESTLRARLDRLPAGLRPRLPTTERIVFIDNPKSGGGTYGAHAQHAQQVYGLLGYETALWQTEYAGHAAELARRAADEGLTLVVVCSGDGGVRETVAGLLQVPPERRPKLSVIPKGTANIMAKTLGLQIGPIPDFFHACIKQLYWARVRSIDVGYLNTDVFACFAGFGFDAAVIAGVPERDKRRLKEWAFLVSGLRTLFGWNPEQRKFQPFQPPEMRVRGVDRDGHGIDVRGYFVAVGNVSDYGTKLFPFMQGARLDDGLLDVIVVRTRDLRELLNIGTQVVARTHLGHPQVTAFQSSAEIVIEAVETPVAMHVDSELLERQERNVVRIAPSALTVLC